MIDTKVLMRDSIELNPIPLRIENFINKCGIDKDLYNDLCELLPLHISKTELTNDIYSEYNKSVRRIIVIPDIINSYNNLINDCYTIRINFRRYVEIIDDNNEKILFQYISRNKEYDIKMEDIKRLHLRKR